MNLNSIKQKIPKQIPAKYHNWILAGLAIVLILVLWYGVSKIVNFLHDAYYTYQQDADKNAANQSEANANMHEVNANQAAENRKELEQDETEINAERANQQKVLADDKQKSKGTRETLNRSLNKVPANRSGADGLADDQLRSDSNRAAAAFNANRN